MKGNYQIYLHPRETNSVWKYFELRKKLKQYQQSWTPNLKDYPMMKNKIKTIKMQRRRRLKKDRKKNILRKYSEDV